ncbi:MAG: phospho-N-acetylmuramoyl-pentapeptide-transferase [Patescibacteria group bacterium]|nr:phospho-N-acetylmuramoyl-pentapeptide-transferase [Patescibacteria group bacterium]
MTETVRHLLLILGSGFLAFIVAVFLTPPFTNFLLKNRLGKQIRETSTSGTKAELYRKLHLKKSGTPTMGGILIWGTTIGVILFSRALSALGLIDRSLLNRKETWLVVFTLITTAILGAIDDYFNIKGYGKSKGINVKPKFLWLTLFAALGAVWFYFKLEYNQIHIPGFGDFMLGWWYIPLFIFIVVACANSVNITDGLDGLAGGLIIIAFGAFGIIAFVKGLLILSAFCAVITGATMAFLWFNIPPARFYMGDTGAISLGATLGVIAMMTDSVAVLPLIGFIFVIETLSVIIQLFSKKFFKKKVFHIAPIHHHFEYLGWGEAKVVMRFWIIGGFAASLGVVLSLLGI